MPYKANRGGHAPDHLREALMAYLDSAFGSYSSIDVVFVGNEEGVMPLKWLHGQLWNCTDMLSPDYLKMLKLPMGATYAQAVRKLAAQA